MVIPRHLSIGVAPLRMSMDPQNWPCEPVSLLLALGCGWSGGTFAQSQSTVTKFGPQIGHVKKSLLTLTLTPTNHVVIKFRKGPVEP